MKIMSGALRPNLAVAGVAWNASTTHYSLSSLWFASNKIWLGYIVHFYDLRWPGNTFVDSNLPETQMGSLEIFKTTDLTLNSLGVLFFKKGICSPWWSKVCYNSIHYLSIKICPIIKWEIPKNQSVAMTDPVAGDWSMTVCKSAKTMA